MECNNSIIGGCGDDHRIICADDTRREETQVKVIDYANQIIDTLYPVRENIPEEYKKVFSLCDDLKYEHGLTYEEKQNALGYTKCPYVSCVYCRKDGRNCNECRMKEEQR